MGARLYLVRHAKAGSRSRWDGDDRVRPLNPAGQRQADALATRLAPLATGELRASPYVRCMQTLAPLGEVIGHAVSAEQRLAEGASPIAVIEMLATISDGSVLCSHGDVIPDTIRALERRGCTFGSAADFRKASVWVLERDDDGAIVRAECWPPPEHD